MSDHSSGQNGETGFRRLVLSLLAVTVSILLAALPWGYKMHGRAVATETAIVALTKVVEQMEPRLRDLEIRTAVLERITPRP